MGALSSGTNRLRSVGMILQARDRFEHSDWIHLLYKRVIITIVITIIVIAIIITVPVISNSNSLLVIVIIVSINNDNY